MKPRQFLIRNSDRGIWNYGVLLRWNILMMGRLSGLPIFILTNYNLALHGNYCVSNWFSLPFAYKRKWEREGKALTLRAPARILRTECGYSARRRAVKTFKSAKGVWGKTRVFPHKQHIKSSRDYPPKQSGGLFRKYTTPLNYSLTKNGQA